MQTLNITLLWLKTALKCTLTPVEDSPASEVEDLPGTVPLLQGR